MKLSLQRALDRYVGVPLCATLSLVERLRPGRAPRERAPSARTAVVILLSEMGALVLAHAMFARLRKQFADGSVHVVVFARNREALDLMGVVPAGHVIAVDDGSFLRFARSLAGALLALWRLRADVVVDCELFARVSSVMGYLSGAPLRVGFHRGTQEGLYRGSFINRPVLYNPYRHVSLQYLALADAIDSTTRPTVKALPGATVLAPPHVALPPAELQAVGADLGRDFPSLGDRPLVLVYPSGGLLEIRAWPAAKYVALAKALCQDGCAVGVIGLASDRELAARIVAEVGSVHCVSLAGYTTSIRHLLGVFHHAALLIGNDGGPSQVAALTPLPSLTLFGPETPALYGSHARTAQVIYRALPCSPCLTAYNHRRSPCDGDNQCLKQIGVAEVMSRTRALLAARDAPARSETRSLVHA